MKYQRIKGTVDILPSETGKWIYLEEIIRNVMARFNYKEIRVPVFETTELFARGIGEGTDIVNKEMYTFTDRVVVVSLSDRKLRHRSCAAL